VEQHQVDVEVVAADLEVHLAADECEPAPELEEGLLQAIHEGSLHIALARALIEVEKLEDVRVFRQLLRQVGFRSGQLAGEVRRRCPDALAKPAGDLEAQHVPRPAAVRCFGRVPLSVRPGVERVHEHEEVCPGKLCSGLLHKLLNVRPALGDRAHVVQVASRQATHVRELAAQVVSEPIDHLGAPAVFGLALKDRSADAPVELEQFGVCHSSGSNPRGPDVGFEFRQQLRVTGRDVQGRGTPSRRSTLVGHIHDAASRQRRRRLVRRETLERPIRHWAGMSHRGATVEAIGPQAKGR
jgi:hypothetical protein